MVDEINIMMSNFGKDGRVDDQMKHAKDASNW